MDKTFGNRTKIITSVFSVPPKQVVSKRGSLPVVPLSDEARSRAQDASVWISTTGDLFANLTKTPEELVRLENEEYGQSRLGKEGEPFTSFLSMILAAGI